MRASRNLALDVVRRQKVFREKEAEIVHLMDRPQTTPDAAIFSDQEIADDRLRMIFVCCHPVVPAEAQIALALKTLCGFSISEIARAFLTTDAAIAKRLTRAKQKIREARIAFDIPTGEALARRLDGVLQSLYLLFNEGYKASSGEKLVREEICYESIRLTGLLAEHPAGNRPKTHALLALMLLNSARIPTRVDGEGNLLIGTLGEGVFLAVDDDRRRCRLYRRRRDRRLHLRVSDPTIRMALGPVLRRLGADRDRAGHAGVAA